MSLRLRLTLAFALIFLLALLSSATALQLWSEKQAESETQELLKGAAARLVVEARRKSPVNLAEFVAEEQAFSDEPLSVAILGPGGKSIDQTGHPLPSAEHLKAHWRVRRVGIKGRVYVLGVNWTQNYLALQHQRRNLFWVCLLLWSVACSAAWMLVGRTLHPLSRLSSQALERSHRSDSEALVASSSDAEVVELVSTLNRLLASVKAGVKARGHFYAAASHELRTPLQALLGHIDLALSRPRTAEEYHQVLVEANLQTHRLKDLVSALLTLNQLETSNPLPVGRIEMGDVVHNDIAQRSEEQRQRLQLELRDCPQECAGAYAQMLVANVLDNAFKYSPPDSPIRVELDEQRFEVSNECPDTSHLHPEKLFIPFYRPDSSRSSQTGGNGLGLALCKSIAESQGWQLSLAIEPDRVTFRLEFPATSIFDEPA